MSDKLDGEAELAVVIGKTGPRHGAQADALNFVFGDNGSNDRSLCDHPTRTPQGTIGKNGDATGGVGPLLGPQG